MGIILGLGGFILLTGGKASVIRASIMAGLYVLAPVLNRPINAWNIISSAGFLILLWNPALIADTGFLLSFVAVISIVFFLGIFENILPEKLKVSHVHNGAVRFIWGLFLVSVSAQIGTLPFTAWYFGRIPLISLIANVIIVPLIGILVALGFTILLLGWIPFLSSGWAESAWIVTKGIQWCSGFFFIRSICFYTNPGSSFGSFCSIRPGHYVSVYGLSKTVYGESRTNRPFNDNH